MATGNKLGFQAGDVTPSGNFMRAGPEGIVSNIDPFALDKLGFTGDSCNNGWVKRLQKVRDWG